MQPTSIYKTLDNKLKNKLDELGLLPKSRLDPEIEKLLGI
jgi:hypothetical protein